MNHEQRKQEYNQAEGIRDEVVRGVVRGREDLLLRGERAYPFESKLKAQYIIERASTNERYPIIDPNDPEVPLLSLSEHIRRQLPTRE
jgi:hypothetical protein